MNLQKEDFERAQRLKQVLLDMGESQSSFEKVHITSFDIYKNQF